MKIATYIRLKDVGEIMQILVQKFGGTSVGTEENRRHVIGHIENALAENVKLVVVVSALGSKPDPYATDTLLSLINFPKHFTSNRELDLLMSCGETISSIVLSNELQKKHISSIALTGAQAGIITSSDFTQAKIKKVNTNKVLQLLQTNDVVIVAGFQGQSETGEITTIGRGGSDTTAAAIGASLNAKRIDIFTDVRGIMTADPRIVKFAQSLEIVTYNELCHLAYQGAKVIHPRAVEIAMQQKIPIRVRSTYSKNLGTLVTSASEAHSKLPERLITGIAHMNDITQIQIELKEGIQQYQSNVFKSMATAGISVDFINISPTGLIFTIPTHATKKANSLLNVLGFHPVMKKNCVKVSVVGAGMSGVPGIAAKLVEALTDQNIQIFQSADSYTTIWVLLNKNDLYKAVNALHDVFELQGELIQSREVN